jgi:hypothetical protein
MTEPKKFQKGKHSYTRWGPNFKEVRVEGPKKESQGLGPEAGNLTMDVDAITAMGVYSNFSVAHQSTDEVILDFGFVAPGQTRGRVRSRIVLSHPQVERLAQLLNQVLREKNSDEPNPPKK